MKKFNLSIGLFSFLFSLTIVTLFSIISYFYIKESILNIKSTEEHLIACYANRITNKLQNIDEFKQLIFGTLESFQYKIAIIDLNNKLLYSSFDVTPTYNLSKLTYFKDDKVFYNSIKQFTDVGDAKIIVKKDLDFSTIKEKSILLILINLIFLVGCSLFLYFHMKSIYTHITKKLDSFFKDAIHEIRTPLGVIQINLDFLENSNASSMALKRAQGGLRNLTSVYETLEYCIKNKKVKYKKESINISYFLKNRIDFFNILAEIKDVAIHYEIQDDIIVYMSRIELQRLIDNNLSNAIKYSKNNTQIKSILSIKDSSLYLEFSNYGDTIQDTSKIFGRYYRGDDIRGGFGLGLSIVKYICDIYDITINVTSNEKGYTQFIYEVPQKNIQRNTV